MQIDSGTLARATGVLGTGTYLMNLLFLPEIMIFIISGKTSGDTETHMSVGYWHQTPSGSLDGTLQASAGKSSETRAKTMSHLAGTVEKIAFICAATIPGEFDLTWSKSDSAYNVHWIGIAS